MDLKNFQEERHFRRGLLLDQNHRSEKTSNGIVETEARKLFLIKAMVRTKVTLTLILCFALSKRAFVLNADETTTRNEVQNLALAATLRCAVSCG